MRVSPAQTDAQRELFRLGDRVGLAGSASENDGLAAPRDLERQPAPHLEAGGVGHDVARQVLGAVVLDLQLQRLVAEEGQTLVVAVDFLLPVGVDDASRVDADKNVAVHVFTLEACV